MLILTRKLNQKLIINDDIEVVILETYKNAVKIGIKAPNHVQVFREEIYREIKKAKHQAMGKTVKPGYKKKVKNAIDKVKRKHRREVIRKDIRRQRVERYKREAMKE